MPRIPRPTDHTSLPRARHWSDDAACVGADTAVFFPVSKGGAPVSMESAHAKSFCDGCQVRSACLAHALDRGEQYGVWGGTDETERAKLREQTRRAADKERRQRQKARADASPTA